MDIFCILMHRFYFFVTVEELFYVRQCPKYNKNEHIKYPWTEALFTMTVNVILMYSKQLILFMIVYKLHAENNIQTKC